MAAVERPVIVPQPKTYTFGGEWIACDGIENIPEFFRSEFDIPKGGFFPLTIVKADGEAPQGLFKCHRHSFRSRCATCATIEIRGNEIRTRGDEHVCMATLCQLLRQRPGYLPQVTVEEQLSFSFRGFHLDIARGGVPTLEYFKKMLRWLFLNKYNYFAIYFEDLFPWESYPQIGKGRGRLTGDELRGIIEYGGQLGIEVFPSLELAGHMEQILMLPEFRAYSEWRPENGCINLHDEEAREFTYRLLEEAVKFFSSTADAHYIHIGGDETWMLGRGRSLDATREFKGPELYESHHARLIEIVEQSGKQAMLWGDMLSGMYLEEGRRGKWEKILASPMWDRSIIANWSYSDRAKEEYEEKVGLFEGRRQVVAPGLSNWGRFYPDFEMALTNLSLFFEVAREHDVPGFLLTSWGDDGAECMYESIQPLLLAAAEIAQGGKKWEEKWIALSGESKELTALRSALGHPCVGSSIKRLMFDDIVPDTETVKYWKEALATARAIELPGEMEFICDFLEAGLKKLDKKLKVDDFTGLAKTYKALWLSERKPENLDKVIRKFTFLHFV